MTDWKVEPLPIHGHRIVDIEGKEIVRDVYEQGHAELIVREHNVIAFALRNGEGWTLGDWQNWLRFHASTTTGREGSDLERSR